MPSKVQDDYVLYINCKIYDVSFERKLEAIAANYYCKQQGAGLDFLTGVRDMSYEVKRYRKKEAAKWLEKLGRRLARYNCIKQVNLVRWVEDWCSVAESIPIKGRRIYKIDQ